VGPSPVLEKLADQTGVEPLRRLSFRTATVDVGYAGGLWRAERLKLLAEEAILSADLKFSRGRLAGSLSARFPEESIRDSSEFKWLLRFVGGMKWVDLDFDVAGDPRSPRVEWKAGEFKKKVETRLAPWMRGILARELEKRFFAARKVE